MSAASAANEEGRERRGRERETRMLFSLKTSELRKKVNHFIATLFFAHLFPFFFCLYFCMI